MSSLISRLQTSDPVPSSEPRVVPLDGQEVDALFETLSSDTRRDILKHLYESPSTPSELAAETETSLQNVHYHLEKLSAVDLVESVATRYSAKGKEMNVFAPANDPLIFVESEETRTRVESRLDGIVGVLSLLAIGSLLVQQLATLLRPTQVTTTYSGQTESFDAAVADRVVDTGPTFVSQLQNLLLEPGALVFVGGVLALCSVVVIRRAL